ncbi:M24 family metallopeptidase [candidate division KSB1 bacterium]|nr:M24 family metallopeptidase [candidate division KSB1 bacterium]
MLKEKFVVTEKISQAIDILAEKDIDLWLIFVRESHSLPDPSLQLILGAHCTWQSAFIISATGETIAIVGNLDAESIKATGAFQEVIPYKSSIRENLINTIQRLSPNSIAINYSKNDYMSDGLTHGMYLLLMDYLKDTTFKDRLISSEAIISAVRGRKSATELEYLKQASDLTLKIFDKVTQFLRPGVSEKEVADFILNEVKIAGVEVSWDQATCPAVFTGPESAGAHFGPTDRVTERGHIMNIDFGVKVNGYCADLQRTWYFLKEDEDIAPIAVQNGFETIRDSIQEAAKALKPGIEGWKVDQVARDYIVSRGFDEYPHALGHQIGREAHDGAGVLCPVWERYGELPFLKVEKGQVYTIEPRLTVEGYGIATIEEEVVVTDDGCEFISTPQTDLILIK